MFTLSLNLTAIREDRTRGGRSSYDGCSPLRPIKLRKESHKPLTPRTQPNVILNPIVIQTSTGSIAIPSSVTPTSSSTLSIRRQKMITPLLVDVTQVLKCKPLESFITTCMNFHCWGDLVYVIKM